MSEISISRRHWLATSAAPALALASRTAPRRPNVVMFMTDDHGAWALGSYGCGEMHTPNIDRLAAGGTRFTRAFACTPVCSPSRMTYMTGAIPSRHGVQDWLVPRDSYGATSHRWLAGFTTWSEVLAANGYTLGMCGKWHMGEDDRAQAGFSYWATVPGGGGPYRDVEFVVNGARRKMPGFKTDAVGDFALDFLDRTKSRPFFLFVPFYAPHTPFDYQPDVYRKPYENATFGCFPKTPMHPWQNPSMKGLRANPDSRRSYSALITGVDANVGRVLRKLDEMGVRENTTVIFTADQGYNAGHHGVWGKGNGTVPFNMYEESLRVPLIWNHPGRIAAGRTPAPMVSSYDFFPTILDYLGVKAPRDARRVGRELRGVSSRQESAVALAAVFRICQRAWDSHREFKVCRAHARVAQRVLRSGSRSRRDAQRDRRCRAAGADPRACPRTCAVSSSAAVRRRIENGARRPSST